MYMESIEKKYLNQILKKFYLIINDLKKIFSKKRNKDKPIDIYEESPKIKKFFHEIYLKREIFNHDKPLNIFGFNVKNNEYSKLKNICLKSFILSVVLRIFVIEILKTKSLFCDLINNISKEIEKRFNFIYEKLLIDFPLDELLKEIYPLFLYSYNIIKKNNIISIIKWEKPDFIIETEELIYFYEFTIINKNNRIEHITKGLSEKIKKMNTTYKENINKFMKSKTKKFKFRIVVWDFFYKTNKKEIISTKNNIIKYLESKKTNGKLIKILKDDKDDRIEFKYFNIEKINQ